MCKLVNPYPNYVSWILHENNMHINSVAMETNSNIAINNNPTLTDPDHAL